MKQKTIDLFFVIVLYGWLLLNLVGTVVSRCLYGS